MEGAPSDTHRNGICENDLNQGKSQVRFLAVEGPHLEKTDKFRWRGHCEARHHWSYWTHMSFNLSASKIGQVVEEEYTFSFSSHLSDASRVKELLHEVFPNDFSTICLCRKDVGDKWHTSVLKFSFREQTTLWREIALESEGTSGD